MVGSGCAATHGGMKSSLLITTRIKDVAKSCSPRCNDVVHHMKALSEDDSESLFGSSISVGEEKAPVGSDILKMCGGLPLAIIVAAGLLARNSAELAEPKILGRYILSSLDQYSTSPGMMKILHISHVDLSLPVKSCFLYLSIFPENYTIKKDRLLRLWGSEGFIPRTYEERTGSEERRHEESLWVTGERYFNELISRRLIQPVFDYDDDQAVGCTVHGVVLDFIRSLSREDNFATTAAELSSGPFPYDTIRRFSLDCSNEDEVDTLASSRVHLSSMRSLTVFGDVEGMLDLPSPSDSEDDQENVHSPPTVTVSLLSTFKLIRVLDLEDTTSLKGHHLKGIGGLVLLRHLGLGGTGISELPEEIGELEQLETLDLRRIKLWHLPASIVKLQNLVHLLLETNEPNIYTPTSNSPRLVAELLSKSNRLRMLSLTLDRSFVTGTYLMPFLEVVVKSNLHSLSLFCPLYYDEWVRLLVDSWKKVTAPPITFEPRRFELILSRMPFSGIPPNMASLVSLTHLHLVIDKVEEEGLGILGGLPNLVLLNLSSQSAPQKVCIIKKGAFPCLKVLSFTCHYERSWLLFAEGAMPQLRRFRFSTPAKNLWNWNENLDFSIEHLTCLTRVNVTINCAVSTVSELEDAEAHIRALVSRNPNKPTLELSRSNEDLMRTEDGWQHS